MFERRAFTALATIALSACAASGSVIPPPAPRIVGIGVFDRSSQQCTVSYDGLVWYAIPAGTFSPIDVRMEKCDGLALSSNVTPVIPAWAKPQGATQAVFIATSLQEAYSLAGMQSLEAAAAPARTPVTWMIGNPLYLNENILYNEYHQTNGDDVQIEDNPALISSAQSVLSWYRPAVSVEGAGHERDIAGALRLGETAFWGITWNQAGVDGTNDTGAPWGTYCADSASYKRPAPGGTCSLLAFEWTARDLTRAYLSGHPEYFSTDPDDLQQRAGFDAAGASSYERALVDAYAAAGETQPLVMMSQQESSEETNAGDQQIMAALYGQAAADGMHRETLGQAAIDVRGFSAAPRAIAFPSIPGGAVPSPVLHGGTLYPATIDYHDDTVAMTFLAGHTTLSRVFEYNVDATSRYDTGFPALDATDTPTLTSVAVADGRIALAFQSPAPLRYGVAVWTNPDALGITGQGVTRAGRAAVVLTFDLQQGANMVSFPCSRCAGATFDYAT